MSARRIITRIPPQKQPLNHNVLQTTEPKATNVVMSRKPNSIILRDFSSDYNIARHVSSDFISDCLVDKSVSRLIKAIYCDPNVPHNHCIRCVSGQFQVYTKNLWSTVRSPAHLTRELTETVYRIMRNHFNKSPDEVLEKFHKRNKAPDMYSIETWLEDLWDDALDNSDAIHASILAIFRK